MPSRSKHRESYSGTSEPLRYDLVGVSCENPDAIREETDGFNKQSKKHEEPKYELIVPLKMSEDNARALQDALAGLHKAADASVVACLDENKFGSLESLSDEFTEAARIFAARLLAERVRRSFVGKVDPETEKSLETQDQKIEHARQVRRLLAKWNFGFETAVGAVQLHGIGNGGPLGCFKLTPYGGQKASKAIAKWDTVKRILDEPRLVDVTDSVYQSPFR